MLAMHILNTFYNTYSATATVCCDIPCILLCVCVWVFCLLYAYDRTAVALWTCMWGRRLRLSVQSIETWHAFITYLIFGILYPFQLTTKTAINFNCESGTLLWEVARVLVYTSIYWNHKRLRPVIYSNRNSCCICWLPAVHWDCSEDRETLQYLISILVTVKVNITKEYSHWKLSNYFN